MVPPNAEGSRTSTRAPQVREPRTWDLFCRVIDNLGDIGTCWRLARALAAQGQRVRLWTDDASALTWMAPRGAAGVRVLAWAQAGADPSPGCGDGFEPGDVVVEAFACDPPPAFVARMAARPRPPVWINLEYLSAEGWVARCHGLPSPQSAGPGRGLTKWFFHPGFTHLTGGLLREADLRAARAAFDAQGWLAAHGLRLACGERLVVLFCYPNPALPALLQALGAQPTLLALTPGPAQAEVGGLRLPAAVRTVALPWLDQEDFDRLLWSADLNLVRGEDSLVRALWAERPLLWQLYPQQDQAHHAKMEAFLARWLEAAGGYGDTATRGALGALWRAWNGLAPPGTLALPPAAPWRAMARAASTAFAELPELATGLIRFAQDKASRSAPT